MNSVANGKVDEHSPFKRVYVQAAAGDAGGAIGARVSYGIEPPSGSTFGDDACVPRAAYDDERDRQPLAARRAPMRSTAKLQRAVASPMSRRSAGERPRPSPTGRVVGWFQGRMEWGPRALGNRSILCDPRRADMKDILNLKIKRRESFRPFAPSILREARQRVVRAG